MCTLPGETMCKRVGSLSGLSLAIVDTRDDTLISYTMSRQSWLQLLRCRAITPGPATHVNRPSVPCPLKASSTAPERQHLDPERRSSWQSGYHISLGNELKAPTLQCLQWSMSPVLEWVAGSAIANSASALLWLEGNYRDKNRDSEGNTPGFQRDCYQDGAEQQPRDCTVFTSVVYIFIAKGSGMLNHCGGRGRNKIQSVPGISRLIKNKVENMMEIMTFMFVSFNLIICFFCVFSRFIHTQMQVLDTENGPFRNSICLWHVESEVFALWWWVCAVISFARCGRERLFLTSCCS